VSAGRLAVTGTSSFLGSRLLRRLASERGGDALVALDVAAPPPALGVRHRAIDFTEPASDQRLLEAMREEEVESVLHTAFFTSPRRDATHAHELESIGTLNLLAAAAAAGVRHVFLRSFTAVYGASGQNPSFLSEERALPSSCGLRWLRDKLEAEQHAASFARRYRELGLTVLRFAPLFGPGVHTFYTRIFDNRVVPMLMGFDPLMQLLHPDDAIEAALRAIALRPRGAFNVVPSHPIPLGNALHLGAKIPVAVPHPVAYVAADALWTTGIGEAPGGFVDFVRYPFVADGARAARELGWSATYSSRQALEAYLRYRHPRGAAAATAEATA
jgi:UDP-glucose 4-epimerase